ncbi:hypothetical protein TB1_000808 [Malus domestica]
MSSTPTPTSNSNPHSPTNYLTTLGLGYGIAISLGFLVLFSTLLLASYICCRVSRHRHHHHHPPQPQNPNPSPEGVILPRIIFVAEDDNEQQQQDDDGNAVVGLHPSVINSYPKFPFSKEASTPDSSTCSICLCDYKDAEMLRMMPECRHYFHLLCLDAWLRLKGSCPVCRNSPLPTPLSTPLQEKDMRTPNLFKNLGTWRGGVRSSIFVLSAFALLISTATYPNSTLSDRFTSPMPSAVM